MPQVPEEHHYASENVEQHSNVNDESRASLNADLEPSAKDRAAEERLEILIQSDLASQGQHRNTGNASSWSSGREQDTESHRRPLFETKASGADCGT